MTMTIPRFSSIQPKFGADAPKPPSDPGASFPAAPESKPAASAPAPAPENTGPAASAFVIKDGKAAAKKGLVDLYQDIIKVRDTGASSAKNAVDFKPGSEAKGKGFNKFQAGVEAIVLYAKLKFQSLVSSIKDNVAKLLGKAGDLVVEKLGGEQAVTNGLNAVQAKLDTAIPEKAAAETGVNADDATEAALKEQIAASGL